MAIGHLPDLLSCRIEIVIQRLDNNKIIAQPMHLCESDIHAITLP